MPTSIKTCGWVEIDEQLKLKMEHDDMRAAKRQKKKTSRPAPAQKKQNKPPNRSMFHVPTSQPRQET
ncbi:hypothetical protein Ddye_008735, partial [Dipteronia dyeriana]